MPSREPALGANLKIAISLERQSNGLKLPLQQIFFGHQLMEELRKKANAKYPDEDIEGALNRYIRYNNVSKAMFVMDGRRYLRGDGQYSI